MLKLLRIYLLFFFFLPQIIILISMVIFLVEIILLTFQKSVLLLLTSYGWFLEWREELGIAIFDNWIIMHWYSWKLWLKMHSFEIDSFWLLVLDFFFLLVFFSLWWSNLYYPRDGVIRPFQVLLFLHLGFFFFFVFLIQGIA